MNLQKLIAGVVAATGLLVVGIANAAADPVDTAITGLTAQATSYVADALGVALVVAGGFWGIRVMKRAMSAAA